MKDKEPVLVTMGCSGTGDGGGEGGVHSVTPLMQLQGGVSMSWKLV